MKKNKFIITVDTEGDNLWEWDKGSAITTYNAKNIPRFQELCESYGFYPVYLINYEMAQDKFLGKYLKNKVVQNKCEIGMHLHAWNTPPYFDLPDLYGGNTYITEYPDEIIYKKMQHMTQLLTDVFEVRPVSHRAGRWAMNNTVFGILQDLGYKVDSSVVAGGDLRKMVGSSVEKGFDYRKNLKKAHYVGVDLLEVPMVVERRRDFKGQGLKTKLKNGLLGQQLWFRTAVSTREELQYILEKNLESNCDYLQFMIHSSELMSGGSPYFRTDDDINRHYVELEYLFGLVADNYNGTTLEGYYNYYTEKKESTI